MGKISPENIHYQNDAKIYIKEYWQERAAGFQQLRRQELVSEKYQLWQKEIFRHLPMKEKLKILDVGCGAGFFSILLAKAGCEVTGIDITPAMIREAKLLASEEKSNISFTVMDAEKLSFVKESFDVVIARNVTWNLTNPAEAYREWLRVLKPGGFLLNYDAEYARDHHCRLSSQNAHSGVSDELLERCHHIYHMLEVSLYERPEWDVRLLKKIGVQSVTVDREISSRIYNVEDDFYISVPMFGIFAKK